MCNHNIKCTYTHAHLKFVPLKCSMTHNLFSVITVVKNRLVVGTLFCIIGCHQISLCCYGSLYHHQVLLVNHVCESFLFQNFNICFLFSGQKSRSDRIKLYHIIINIIIIILIYIQFFE